MIVSSRLLRLLPLVVAVLLTRTAMAQVNTTSGGGVSTPNGVTVQFPTSNTQFANLSTYDCLHNQTFDFQFVAPWVSGQEAEFILSLDSTCSSPAGASLTNTASSCQTAAAAGTCPSIILDQPNGTLPQPSDQMTSNFSGTNPQFPITTSGVWGFYNTQSTSMLGSNTYNPNNTTCPTGNASNTLVYICVVLNESATATTTTSAAATPYGALSIALDSTTPDTPDQPSVTPLDSGLNVTWTAVTNAFYYNVIVVNPSGAINTDGGTADDAGTADAGDGGTGSSDAGGTIVSTTQVGGGATSVQIFGLNNGQPYLVYVESLDQSGTSPPTTSNVSPLSPAGSGTPAPSYSYFEEYKAAGGKENGCSSTGIPAALALLAALAILRRRRQRRSFGAGLVLLLALAGLSRPAQAQDENPSTAPAAEGKSTVDVDGTAVESPVTRQGSPEYVRVEVMTGPYYPNPDQGLSSKPFATVFPAKNQLLWRLQIHANIFSGFGHLALGLGAGIWNTTGHALTQTGGQAGDVESFYLYPITPILSYRADFIYTLWNVPIIPVVKVGYGFVVFQDLKDGRLTSGTTNGTKWTSEGWAGGPEWSVGLEFPLDFLDQQRSANLDEDFGINSIGIFAEYGWMYWKGFNGGLPLGGWDASGGLYLAW